MFWIGKKKKERRKRKENTWCDTLPCMSSCSLSSGKALLWWIWAFFSCPHLNGSPRWVAQPASSHWISNFPPRSFTIPNWTGVKRKFGENQGNGMIGGIRTVWFTRGGDLNGDACSVFNFFFLTALLDGIGRNFKQLTTLCVCESIPASFLRM